MIAICFHCVARELHVVEHALQLLRELEAALDLELGEHAALGVVRDGARVEEALGEVRFVVALEDVLFGDVAEDGDGFVEDLFDFVVGFLGG